MKIGTYVKHVEFGFEGVVTHHSSAYQVNIAIKKGEHPFHAEKRTYIAHINSLEVIKQPEPVKAEPAKTEQPKAEPTAGEALGKLFESFDKVFADAGLSLEEEDEDCYAVEVELKDNMLVRFSEVSDFADFLEHLETKQAKTI